SVDTGVRANAEAPRSDEVPGAGQAADPVQRQPDPSEAPSADPARNSEPTAESYPERGAGATSVPQADQEDEARDLLDLDANGAPVSLPPFQLRPSLTREAGRVPAPDGAEIDDLSSSPPPQLLRGEEYREELTLDELRTPQRQQAPVEAMVVVEDEPTEEADPTAGLLDEELEDIEVDAYSGPPPMTLEEAELAADAGVLWEEVWTPEPLPDVASDETTTWVVLVDAGGVGDYLATLLEASGNRIVRVLHEAPYPREDRTLFVPDPTEPSAFEIVVEALGTVHGAVRILHLWALDATDEPSADASGGWAGIVGLVQELRAQSVPARLHLVTRGAFRPPDTASGQTLGAIWGLARLLAVEVPFLFGGIVDLDPDDEDPDALLRHLLGGGTDAQPVVVGAPRARQEYQLRAGAERLRRAVRPVTRVPVTTTEVATDGPWVIAGDVDGAALELVQWLVSRGVTKVFLIGSQPPPPDVLRGVLELQRKNVGCIVVRADPADPKDAGQVRSRLAREGSVRGVVLRVAATPCSLQELDLNTATPALNRATAMQALLWELAPSAARWIWAEGRSFDGAPGGGVAAIAGEALTAAIRVPGAAGAALHTGPSTELSSGQAVRLMSRLGPAGGVHGVWRGKGTDTPPPAPRKS
ncbi:MAG: KR domain-containing protein, partial [Myxococcota bacterium]